MSVIEINLAVFLTASATDTASVETTATNLPDFVLLRISYVFIYNTFWIWIWFWFWILLKKLLVNFYTCLHFMDHIDPGVTVALFYSLSRDPVRLRDDLVRPCGQANSCRQLQRLLPTLQQI